MKAVITCAKCGAEAICVLDNGDSVKPEHHCPKTVSRAQVAPKPVARIKLHITPIRRAF